MLVPESDAVHVWWVDLAGVALTVNILSAAEQARAERLRYPDDRARWIRSRIALRQILARYNGQAPAELRFDAIGGGKPVLAGGLPPRFNLAHAGDRAVVAVSGQREVGIDLEPLSPGLPSGVDLDALVATTCTAREAAALATLPRVDRQRAFLQIWTLKEAWLKGRGVGLQLEPRSIEVQVQDGPHPRFQNDPHPQPLSALRTLDPRPLPQDTDARSAAWALRILDAGAGWVAALAVAGPEPGPEITMHSWPSVDRLPIVDDSKGEHVSL